MPQHREYDVHVQREELAPAGNSCEQNEAVGQDILFVRDPDDANRYVSVSGKLTYSVSETSGFSDCEMSGYTTVPIETSDADFSFITGVGLPSLLVGTGSTPDP